MISCALAALRIARNARGARLGAADDMMYQDIWHRALVCVRASARVYCTRLYRQGKMSYLSGKVIGS